MYMGVDPRLNRRDTSLRERQVASCLIGRIAPKRDKVPDRRSLSISGIGKLKMQAGIFGETGGRHRGTKPVLRDGRSHLPTVLAGSAKQNVRLSR
jgi:hypothetical protein